MTMPPMYEPKKAADLVAQHGQPEEGGQVARAEKFAGNGGGGGDGCQPSETESGGEKIEVQIGFRCGQINQYHGDTRSI